MINMVSLTKHRKQFSKRFNSLLKNNVSCTSSRLVTSMLGRTIRRLRFLKRLTNLNHNQMSQLFTTQLLLFLTVITFLQNHYSRIFEHIGESKKSVISLMITCYCRRMLKRGNMKRSLPFGIIEWRKTPQMLPIIYLVPQLWFGWKETEKRFKRYKRLLLLILVLRNKGRCLSKKYRRGEGTRSSSSI